MGNSPDAACVQVQFHECRRASVRVAIGRQSWTHATRWYLAHLLLFIGLVLFVRGLLTLTGLAAARRPRVGYAARVLVVIGMGGSAAIFVAEMVAGRLGAVGVAATKEFLDTMFSGPIAGPMLPVGLAFFVSPAVFAVPLVVDAGPLRWPAVVLLVGVPLVTATAGGQLPAMGR